MDEIDIESAFISEDYIDSIIRTFDDAKYIYEKQMKEEILDDVSIIEVSLLIRFH